MEISFFFKGGSVSCFSQVNVICILRKKTKKKTSPYVQQYVFNTSIAVLVCFVIHWDTHTQNCQILCVEVGVLVGRLGEPLFYFIIIIFFFFYHIHRHNYSHLNRS